MVDTATEKPPARKEVRRDEDMKMLVNILMKECLCEDLGPRCYQGMSKLKDVVVKKIPYLEKIKLLSERLDRRTSVVIP
ncbi:hypothetical protein DPMN_143741 [Dreissena polymorpha]|uniref:Uncharacterized protein n=1 Tax=Dreissena polymorpha TaxID=45954 RepID=A0A9D4GGX9_DREPO|nr:hypothetical protein DPMN_143741 [Dreissena polymorpha]